MNEIPGKVAPRRAALRDLDEAAFLARYKCDRFTAALLGNRFRYVMKHMTTKLRTNAFSVVIRDMDDFCTTVSGPPELGWPMPVASLTNPVHWGPVSDSVRNVIEEYGIDALQRGDVLICNDSYRTGKHLNDVSFIRPLFHAGKLCGAVHITAHQLDLGSRIPGGLSLNSATLWEDGLVIAPMLLYRAGVAEKSTFGLIASYTRYPETILADLEVIRACLDLGEQLLLDSIDKYGIAAYLGAMEYACDAASEAMETALEILPDGEYSGQEFLDGDGLSAEREYVLAVRIRKHGARLELDFSGTSESARSSLNCSWLDVKTGVLMALKMLLDRHSVPCSGSMRNIDLVLPFGSIVNPKPPAATMFYFALVQATIRVVFAALNPALGEKAIAADSGSTVFHRAYGRTQDGAAWGNPSVLSGIYACCWGATAAGDADGFAILPWMNFPMTPFEIMERNAEIVVMRSEIVPDTAGPGLHRGGAAQINDVYWLHGGFHHQTSMQMKRAPYGAHGGVPGSYGGDWLFDPERCSVPRHEWVPGDIAGDLYRGSIPLAGMMNPHTNTVDPRGNFVFQREEIPASAGTTHRALSHGGGGWGDPFARDPERVLRDVRDGYISIAGAARDYGVLINGDPYHDPEHLSIDFEASAARRGKLTGRDGSEH